jgi:pimeloyl-ACP methyl ester carboxylesterase
VLSMRAFTLCVVLALSIPVFSRAADPPVSLEGDWAGALAVGAARLNLILHFTRAGDTWSGTMDSVDQGARGIPIDLVTFDGKGLHFEMNAIGGSYDGVLAPDGNSFAGTWQQSGQKLPLDFARTDDAAALLPKRPQEPKPPLPYAEEEVSYPNPGAGITLAGTLSLPRTPGPHPAVLLITGSGPQDRDEFVMGHRPFLVLADHLVRTGIVVLRVDDRGIGKSTGSFTTATIADFAGDALEGVRYLTTRQEVDGKRIGLVGHSEGGIVAPMVAVKSPDVAFVVLMAGAGVKAAELMALQAQSLMRAGGASEAMVAANSEAQRKMFAIVQEDPDPASAAEKLAAVGDELMAKFAAIDSTVAETAAPQIKGGIEMVNSPWFRQFLSIDPAATLRQVDVPVLAINGSLDLQVDARQNLPAIEKALRDGGNPDVTVRELPGLNHLFQTARTGSPSEYSTIEETMSPAAMQAITEWILSRTQRPKQ